MAYWTVTNIGTNTFTANIYNLENNFTSDNYLRMVWASRDYGNVSTTMGNIVVWIGANTPAKTFSTKFEGLSPGTAYILYCYAQVNDGKYYRINNNSGGAYISFVTDTEQRVMTAPNEPSLDSNRIETASHRPAARIKLSGMTDKNANFVWRVKDTADNTISEFEFDDVGGGTDSERTVSFLSYMTEAKFCRTYKMQLGAIDKSDSSNQAWSGWSAFTTQPTNILLNHYPNITGRFGNKVRIKFNLPSDEYSYYQVEITGNGTEYKSISRINKSDVTQGALFEFTLPQTGIYTITVAVAYAVGNTALYAVDENGNRAEISQTVSYMRPDYFGWTVTPQTGVATANVPSDDWNRLCQNVYAVVCGYLGRKDDPYGVHNNDRILLPNDEALYGALAGLKADNALTKAETAATVGAKIDTDKTLYAWRYNAVNYILCCVNNSDSETDVTNADYAEHFAEGEPVYARYLTALSDKVNGV